MSLIGERQRDHHPISGGPRVGKNAPGRSLCLAGVRDLRAKMRQDQLARSCFLRETRRFLGQHMRVGLGLGQESV